MAGRCAARNNCMSNITRRQDQGLGKTAAGGSGGSFASHDRASAAAPPAQSVQRTPEQYASLVRQAEKTQQHFLDMQKKLQQQSEQLYDMQVAAHVKQQYPDAHTFEMLENGDGENCWSFSEITRSDGSSIDISDDDDDFFTELALDSPRPVPYSKREYATHSVDLDEALAADLTGLHRRYIDTDGEFDDNSFSRLWSNMRSSGDVIGNVRSRGDFEQELRTHLGESANEMNDGERVTFFEDGDIDAWVDEAMERYESGRPNDDEDSHAFFDAIHAARPADH